MEFDPVAYINTPRWQESRFGLERIRELLNRMGRPQDHLQFVHVGGTNGKGSTCAYIASILQESGLQVGLFTSPYLETFEERIQINGENISIEKLTDITLVVKKYADDMEEDGYEHPTEFELMTAVAFEYFSESQCDIVVAEVGMGGTLDSTNVLEHPEVTVITTIGLDHMAFLGDTIAKIAGEKAGIIKDGIPVVTCPQEPSAMKVLRNVTDIKDCDLTVADYDRLEIEPITINDEVRHFSYKGFEYETTLLARYQPGNAAIAIEAVKVLRHRGWHVSEKAIQRGIAKTRWPGRFEVLSRTPLTIVDGAHNPQGASALMDSLTELLAEITPGAEKAGESIGTPRVFFIMGVLADKDYDDIIDEALPLAYEFVTITPPNGRALSSQDLALAIKDHIRNSTQVDGEEEERPRVYAAQSIPQAVGHARAYAHVHDVIVAFGSLYSVSAIKAAVG